MIARFDCWGHDADMEPVEDGLYVLYEDYLKEIEILQSSIDFWRNSCKELGDKL